MISTQIASDSTTTTVRVKSLDSRPVRAEEKDLEIEDEEPANNEPSVDEQQLQVEAESETAIDAEQEEEETSIELGLSTRAAAIKEYIKDTTEVKAIVLKSDGTSEEISFSASSNETRKLLSGRPSIVGEIEDLQIVVVKALDISSESALNKNKLPVPLCHSQSRGDYVLFRVDGSGKAVDVSLKEYAKYVADHKTLTETATKQYNAENELITSRSPFGSDSKHTMKTLIGALETKILASKGESEISESDLRSAVKEEIQSIVDEMVSDFTASPMEDPDYIPEDDIVAESQSAADTESGTEVEETDVRPWREQFKDALKHVEFIGKVHGEAFAERICETFYELNGTEPSLKELTDLYDRIKTDFANEAEEELNDESDTEEEVEEEEEEETEEEVDDEEEEEINDELAAALDHVREIARLDGSALAEKVCDALYEETGEEATLEDLTAVWQSVKEEFVAEVEAQSEMEVEDDDDDEAEEDLTPFELLKSGEKIIAADWVSRAKSLYLSQKGREPTATELESTIREFALEMAESVLKATEIGSVQSEDEEVDDESEDEMELESEEEVDSEEEETEELEDGDYDPLNATDQALAELDSAEDLKHEVAHFDDTMLNTPVRRSGRGGGVSWAVYFEESDLNEEAQGSKLEEAIEGFEMMNKREPTKFEISKMREFLAVPIEICDDGELELELEASSAVITTPAITSKLGGAVSWKIFFGSTRGDLDGALEAFKATYGHPPSILELKHLQLFLSGQSVESESASTKSTETATPSKVLVSPLTEKKTAKRFNVYFEKSKYSEKETEEIAIKWFNRFNKREPSEEDLSQIRSFIEKDADLEEQEFMVSAKALNFEDVEVDDDLKETEAPIASSTSGVVKKETATKYTLTFDDDEKREDGDEERAIKWFKRFNNREPSKEETQQIKQFVKADEDDNDNDMIDIE